MEAGCAADLVFSREVITHVAGCLGTIDDMEVPYAPRRDSRIDQIPPEPMGIPYLGPRLFSRLWNISLNVFEYLRNANYSI